MNRTKIVATYGPACEEIGIVESLISAGVNIFRFNASHENEVKMGHDIKKVREAACRLKKNVGIMVDLQGPKLRIGDLPEEGIELREGEQISLISDINQSAIFKAVTLGNPDLMDDLRKGHRIYLDDGTMELKVVDVKKKEVICDVVLGGILKSRKGMNLPDTAVSMPTILPKDIKYIEFSINNNVDWLAVSFVRTPDDINIVRKIIKDNDSNIRIIAKIEKHEAVTAIDSIIEAADAVMVARGDLGVEIATEDVPLMQKKIIEECLKVGKPAVVATQMLNSMILNPRPTRAEVSDVANAVFDSADALMLSGETSVGKYPVDCVKMMARICQKAESFINYEKMLNDRSQWAHDTIPEAVSFAACKIASDLNARAIITSTQSGLTARKISRYRPDKPIIACSQNQFVINQLMLSWGVVPIKTGHAGNIDEMLDMSLQAALDKREISRGDVVVITAGVMVNIPGSTNLIKVHQV